jgi:hypothetical protein
LATLTFKKFVIFLPKCKTCCFEKIMAKLVCPHPHPQKQALLHAWFLPLSGQTSLTSGASSTAQRRRPSESPEAAKQPEHSTVNILI